LKFGYSSGAILQPRARAQGHLITVICEEDEIAPAFADIQFKPTNPMTNDSSQLRSKTALLRLQRTFFATLVGFVPAAGLLLGWLNYSKTEGNTSTVKSNARRDGTGSGINDDIAIGGQNPPAAPHQSPADPGIFMECYQRARAARVPANGRVDIIRLTSPEQGTASLIFNMVQPGSDYPLPGGLFNTVRCTATNYGTDARFNVTFQLHAKVSEPKDDGTGGAIGSKIIAEHDWPISIGRLDPGTDAQFDFYISNFLDNFVEINLPNQAVIQQEAGEIKTIEIMRPDKAYKIVFKPFSKPPN
jgi:hypothetical protein